MLSDNVCMYVTWYQLVFLVPSAFVLFDVYSSSKVYYYYLGHLSKLSYIQSLAYVMVGDR